MFWLYRAAWNTGLTAAKREEWTPAAVCFSACARLISFFFTAAENGTTVDKTTEAFRSYQLRNVSAMLLTGACLLEICKVQCRAAAGDPTAPPRNTQGLVAQARSALAKQQQTVDALLAVDVDVVHESILLTTLRNHGFVLQHELSCLSGDTSNELTILQKAGDLPCTSSDVITMAENSALYGSAAAAARGFDIGLTMLLAAPQRDTSAIASVIRHRIEIEERAAAAAGSTTTGAQEKLAELYTAAATHLALLAGSYPGDEAAWLVTTAFNRGVAHHRMFRFAQAQFMFEMARSILPHALRSDPSLERLQSRIDEAISIVKAELLSGKPAVKPALNSNPAA
jgi:hypothetical protein